MELNKVYNEDCLEGMKRLPDNGIDAIVTDPPYGLSFMGKKWDYEIPSVEIWKECLRVLKPGGHMLCACGTRTQHRMAVNIEDAGFEIRDVITWHYGSGFPKSLNVSNSIEAKMLTGSANKTEFQNLQGEKAQRGNWGISKMSKDHGFRDTDYSAEDKERTTKVDYSTDEAKQWEGWGTALKPATEFWTLARKPLGESTVAENVLKHGTGGININGCRIGMSEEDKEMLEAKSSKNPTGKVAANVPFVEGIASRPHEQGRFPANLIFDDFTAALLDEQTGILKSGTVKPLDHVKKNNVFGKYNKANINNFEANSGGASRFFYVAKPSKAERGEGNNHPTVKPIKLIEYLVKLLTVESAIVLDPFLGSGTTAIACINTSRKYIGFEKEENYYNIIDERIWKAILGDLY